MGERAKRGEPERDAARAERRRQFAAAAREERPDLALLCLLICAEADPALDQAGIDAVQIELDELAGRLPYNPAGGPGAWARNLAELLGTRLGFRGSPGDYRRLGSSLLHEVVRRRRGLPILLSVVWMEVARRAGAPVYGVALPGHFVVGFGDPAGPDVAGAGGGLSEDGGVTSGDGGRATGPTGAAGSASDRGGGRATDRGGAAGGGSPRTESGGASWRGGGRATDRGGAARSASWRGGGRVTGGHVLVDPFDGGRVLTGREAATLVRGATGEALTPGMLTPAGPLEIVLRILNNIRAWAQTRPEHSAVHLWALDLSLLLPSHPARLRHERAQLLVQRGEFLAGAAELEEYARVLEPVEPAAATALRREAAAARARLN